MVGRVQGRGRQVATMTRIVRALVVAKSDEDARPVLAPFQKAGISITHKIVSAVERLRGALALSGWDIVLIVHDYGQPQFQSVVPSVREAHPDIPCVVISEAPLPSLAVEALKLGAADYVLRDDLDRLPEIVDREVQLAAARRPRASIGSPGDELYRMVRALLDGMNVAILVVNDGGLVRFANRMVERLFGFVAADLAGRDAKTLLARSPAELPPHAFSRVTAMRSDGSTFEIEVSTAPILLENRPSRVCTLREVSDGRVSHPEVRHLEKWEDVGRLAEAVAREMDRTLAAITTYGAYVTSDIRMQAELTHLESQVRHSIELLHEMRALSATRPPSRGPMDLNAIVRRVESILRPGLPVSVELSVQCDPELYRIEADQAQLEAVVVHLCNRAREAITGGGKLSVETRNVRMEEAPADIPRGVRPNRFVRLTVTDSGTPSAVLEAIRRVLEVSNRNVRPLPESPLGNTLEIVEEHGGYLKAPRDTNGGMKIEVYLPAVPEPVPAPPLPREVSSGPSARTILVVEDDPNFRRVVVRVLQGIGFQALPAGDGQEALRVLQRHIESVDLALVDLVIPGMSGRVLYESMRMVKPELRFLFMTGYSVSDIDQSYFRDAGLALLHKPFDSALLERKIRELLQAPAAAPSVVA